jgi:hypothetical protein
MKTLNEAALDYARAFCPYEDSNPRTQVAGAYEAFMAGAAAMAERIAAGSFFPAARLYYVEAEYFDGKASTADQAFRKKGAVVAAFSREEARLQYCERSNGQVELHHILTCRPATSEEIKKAKS